MAGDVGKAVQRCPLYAGYMPSWSLAPIPTGCGPTQRVNLEDRHLPSQADKTASAPGKTIYATDCATVAAADGQKRGALSPDNNNLPPGKPFMGTTVQRDLCASVLDAPDDGAYYTRRMKALRQQQTDEPAAHHRKSDMLQNSKRGRGGATGLACLHQPAAVAEAAAAAPEQRAAALLPGHAAEAADYSQMSKSYGFGASTFVKLSRGRIPPTSYGRDFGSRGSNPRDRMPAVKEDFADASSTHDLYRGTAKSVAHKRLPGYLGHVPADPANAAKIRGDADVRNRFHKANLLTTCTNDLPGYSGHKPISIYNDTGRPMKPEPELTTSGTAAKYVADDEVERAMNHRDHAKSNELKAFFSRGEGEDVGQVADSYFQKFRPLEGLMKSGPAAEHAWISEQQLRRSYITGTTGE
uniref:Flagellar associated protein n=1 Tax=Eutreptiella gymnastica TaxID=73025 RepID=A0A7S4GFS5_9EUGL